jgi:putative DNA primase/helicase
LRHEKIVDFRYEDKSQFKVVQAKLVRMAIDHSVQVSRVNLSLLPDGLSDREQDNWIYLLMIAQLGGDEWLEKAKEAALAMHANVEPSVSTGVELLSDIREIFALECEPKISTVGLIDQLIEDVESPWSVWNKGNPVSPRQLAKLLEPYGIKSKNLKFKGQTLKGFEVAQFEDAFKRYLEPEILPQPRNDTPEALIYKLSAVADDPQPKSAVAQRYDDLFEDIF